MAGGNVVRLVVTPPFDWPALIGFFAGRATPGVESVDGTRYRRSVVVDGRPATLDITWREKPQRLDVRLHGNSSRIDDEVIARVRRMFDLDAPLDDIHSVLHRDKALRSHLRRNPGVRVPGTWDGFELTIRAILGQQVSVKAATTLAGRVARRYGESMPGASGDGAPERLFPRPDRLSRARFNGMGIVGARIASMRSVAKAVENGELAFDGTQTSRQVRETLQSIKGIGDWTAQYVAMRALKDADAFPSSDLGLVKAVAWPDRVTPKELAARSEQWRPWRAYAALLLWGSLPDAGG